MLDNDPEVRRYIQETASAHDFAQNTLIELFGTVRLQQDIIDLISRPAEKTLQWHEYRAIFMTRKRIDEGVAFINAHRAALKRAEQVYGVPGHIIAAIIGVETFYGRITGKHQVLSALSTLAFGYPRRADFFRRELTEFLLLCREQNIDPRGPLGSYAGAVGLPQFISSSYRNYAVDFDDDQRIDLWHSTADAIGSVGNYLKAHGWQAGEPVAERVAPGDTRWRSLVVEGLKPLHNDATLKKYGLIGQQSSAGLKSVMSFQQPDSVEAWVGHRNFYAITRYNHSRMYALAVYQLSEALQQEGLADAAE